MRWPMTRAVSLSRDLAASSGAADLLPQPPWVNPPRVSSSGRPGPCITPSRVT